MTEQTPETPVVEAVVTELPTPETKKSFFTKKRIAVAAALTGAAVTAMYLKLKKSDKDSEEENLWTTPETESETAVTAPDNK